MRNIPKYKYYLSHLFDQVLEETTSPFNAHLKVVLARGRIRLEAEKSIYSYEDLYVSFAETFNKINLIKNRPLEVLVLGGGFLSIPQLLRKHLHDQSNYKVIEIDSEVIRLARNYLSPFHWENVAMECADASKYFESEHRKYDLICVDVFEDDEVPDALLQEAFIKQSKEALKEEGQLVFSNLIPKTAAEKISLAAFAQSFRSVFPENRLIHTKGNRVFVGRL